MIITALASFAATSVRVGRETFNREQAFQAAEAGVDYYRWYLAHFPTNYQGGNGITSPYPLKDKDGNTVGQFSITITPPSSGSTLVKIKSVGASTFDPSFIRKIVTQVSKPSIAEHSFAGNDATRFGTGTTVYGSIFINKGIHFDGVAYNLVSSSLNSYTDPDSDSCTRTNSYAVHTCVYPADSTYRSGALPINTNVFKAGRTIGQPQIDFSGFTVDIGNLKIEANANGFYRDAAGTGYVGYHVVLKTDDTFDLYKISSWQSLGNCTTQSPNTSSWSINAQTLVGNYAFPADGIMFFQDNIVIDGQINSARITIAAALLPEPTDTTKYKNIIINNDLLYTKKDGTDSIGLVAQGGVMVGMISDTNLEIDGALMAQHNAVGRFYYTGSSCTYKLRTELDLYGMIASYARYGFAYGSPASSGYTTRVINYDANLLYAPPPNYPLTSDQYQILSWQEVKN